MSYSRCSASPALRYVACSVLAAIALGVAGCASQPQQAAERADRPFYTQAIPSSNGPVYRTSTTVADTADEDALIRRAVAEHEMQRQ